MSNLMPNEQLLVDTDLHWIIFFWPVLISCGLLYFLFKPHSLLLLNYLVAAGIAYLLGDVLIRYISTHFTLTTARLIKKTGFLRTQSWEIGLQHIESVRLQQTLLGKMFGYGDVIVSGVGGDQILFALVDDPAIFQQKIFQAMEQKKA